MSETKNQQLESAERRLALPQLPPWPTSRPGPKVTAVPPGMKRMHLRTEQVVEVDYDQEQGKSAVRSE